MRFAFNGHDLILRQLHFFALQIFLQLRFGVLVYRLGIYSAEFFSIQQGHHFLCRIKPTIEINRTHDGLQRIRQNGRPTPTSTL